jgi:hypothetical protein
MAEAKIFPKGITFFEPRQNAPTWVKGSVIINMRELVDWVKANPDVLVEHEKYGKQLKLTVTEKGMQVDTWKPTQQAKPTAPNNDSQDIPF